MERNDEYVFEHLWRYFQLHSQQRMTVFNFYLVISGMTATGIGFGLQQGGGYHYVVSLLGLFLLMTSFIFWKLDQRGAMLVKEAELAFTHFEKIQMSERYSLFIIDANNKFLSSDFKTVWSFGRCFRYSFFLMGYTGFICIFLPLILKAL